MPTDAYATRPKRHRRVLGGLLVLFVLLGVPVGGLGYIRVTGEDPVADALLRGGRYEEAIFWCDLLIRMRVTENLSAYANRAHAMAFLGMHEEVAAEFDRLGQEFPGADATLSRLQGWFFEEQGQLENALRYYEESVRRRPDAAPGHVDRARVLDLLGRFDASLAAYDEAVRLEPDNQDALRGREAVRSRWPR